MSERAVLRDEEGELACYKVKNIFISRVRGFKFFFFFFFNIIYVYELGPGRVCIIPGPNLNPFRIFLLKPKPTPFASRIG